MELLEGQPLSRTISLHGRLDASLAAYIGCQVLSGLASAHDAGVVHRDLKPDNIFLMETGAVLPGVKILDFGISRMIAGSEHGATRLTQTGTVIGTPEYMSPEQARGREDIDGRSDLFSLGVILYECLAGDLPFKGANYNAVLARIVSHEPLEPSSLCPDIPAHLEALVLKALSKSRRHRFGSAFEMFEELLPYVEERAVGLIPHPARVSTIQGLVGEGDRDEAETISNTDLAADTNLSWESDDVTLKRRSSARIWVFLAVLLLTTFSGVVTGLLMWGANSEDHGNEEPRVAVASVPTNELEVEVDAAAPPSPEPDLVSIELVGLPVGASVFLDAELVLELPLKLPRDGPVREIRIEAEGFEPYRQLLTPRENRSITPDLQRVVEPSVEVSGDAGGPRRPLRHKGSRSKTKRRAAPDYFVPIPEPGYLGDP